MNRRDFLRSAGVGSMLATGVVGNLHADSGPATALRPAVEPVAALVPIARGRFHGSDFMHRAAGAATLYRCSDGSCLLRLTSFKVTNGPDLHVVLARHPDPANARDIRLGYVILGRLLATQGEQDYAVPAAVDVAAFASVAIYCRIFGVLFAPAPLSPAGDAPQVSLL